jgi:hypothetical protein
VIIAVVVVILIVGLLAVLYWESATSAIQVGEIDIWAPDNVCGLDANPIYFFGFNSSTGAGQSIDFDMPNFNATPCSVTTVTTNTTGFTLSGVQVPLSIPASGSASMNITITAPASPFAGSLNLVLR